jgi:hypothetical protein
MEIGSIGREFFRKINPAFRGWILALTDEADG